jgi:hypothetical protein
VFNDKIVLGRVGHERFDDFLPAGSLRRYISIDWVCRWTSARPDRLIVGQSPTSHTVSYCAVEHTFRVTEEDFASSES